MDLAASSESDQFCQERCHRNAGEFPSSIRESGVVQMTTAQALSERGIWGDRGKRGCAQ